MSATLRRFATPAMRPVADPFASRRVTVGDDLTLVFENRETLRFRLQELARVARLTSAASVRPERDWYERLLPTAGRLLAAVWLGGAGRRATPGRRQAVAAGAIAFRDAAGYVIAGHFHDDRVRDRVIGLAGWVEFAFMPSDAAAFATPGRGWHLVVAAGGVSATSGLLGDAVWRSLDADIR